MSANTKYFRIGGAILLMEYATVTESDAGPVAARTYDGHDFKEVGWPRRSCPWAT